MKKLIICLISLLLAVALGLLIHNHPAYVFITMGHISIQASLWFVILVLLVSCFLGQQLWRLLRGVYHIPLNLQRFVHQRGEKKAQQLTNKALCALLESRWLDAESCFNKSANRQSEPFFYYVAAGQAAFQQQKFDVASGYLTKAQAVANSSQTLALEMVRARWQLQHGDYVAALGTLQVLQKISPKHSCVLNGLKEVYLASQKWSSLQELLPQLQRHGGMDQAEFELLEQQVLNALLDQAAQLNSAPALEKVWQSLPKKWRSTPPVLANYARHLIDLGQHATAEKILQSALKQHRDAVLLEQYARVNSGDSVKQLSRAESWLQQDNQNAELFFCLGKLCTRYRLWGKAKNYLEMSLKYAARPEIYPVLGEVLEQLDEKSAALNCYKAGMNFISGKATAPAKV